MNQIVKISPGIRNIPEGRQDAWHPYEILKNAKYWKQ